MKARKPAFLLFQESSHPFPSIFPRSFQNAYVSARAAYRRIKMIQERNSRRGASHLAESFYLQDPGG